MLSGQLRSSPYHAMCNGAVENVNKTICDMLASFVCEYPMLWDEYLPFVVFAYNSSAHISLKKSPFYLLYGHDPIQPDLISGRDRRRDPLQPKYFFLNRWHNATNAARAAMRAAQITQKHYYDKNVQEENISEGNFTRSRSV